MIDGAGFVARMPALARALAALGEDAARRVIDDQQDPHEPPDYPATAAAEDAEPA